MPKFAIDLMFDAEANDDQFSSFRHRTTFYAANAEEARDRGQQLSARISVERGLTRLYLRLPDDSKECVALAFELVPLREYLRKQALPVFEHPRLVVLDECNDPDVAVNDLMVHLPTLAGLLRRDDLMEVERYAVTQLVALITGQAATPALTLTAGDSVIADGTHRVPRLLH